MHPYLTFFHNGPQSNRKEKRSDGLNYQTEIELKGTFKLTERGQYLILI